MTSISRPPRVGQTTVDFGPLFDPGAYAAEIPLRVDIDGVMQFIRDMVARPRYGYGNIVAITSDSNKCVGASFDGESFDSVRTFIEVHAKDNLYWTANQTKRPVNDKPSKGDIGAMR